MTVLVGLVHIGRCGVKHWMSFLLDTIRESLRCMVLTAAES